MKILIFFPICIATILLSAPAFADPARDVRCQEIAFSRSVETSDLERFTSFIDPDARFVGDEVLRGPGAVSEAWKVFFDANGPRIKWRPQIVEVLQDEKLALSRGPYQTVVTDGQGKQSESWGTFNSIWRLQLDGEWKVVFDAGSPAVGPMPDNVKQLLEQSGDCPDE